MVFDVAEKGFVPVPIILRKLIRHLSAPELRVLIYLHLRASRYGICYPTYDEIVHELGLMGRKNLLPHLKSLEEKRFISTHAASGKTFFLIYDPRVAIAHLLATGRLSEQELFEINELYADLNQKPVAATATQPLRRWVPVRSRSSSMSEPADVDVPVGALSAVEKLSSGHQVKGFKSGKHSLDVFLKRHALKNQEVDSAQTFVVHRSGHVVGYYSLTVGSVDRADRAPGITAEMPPDYPIPIVLLARLAVDRNEQGRGLGSALLKDAFFRIASAADIVGACAILVHAIDAEAKAFYEHFDFQEFPAGTLHLMLSLKDVRAVVAGAK